MFVTCGRLILSSFEQLYSAGVNSKFKELFEKSSSIDRLAQQLEVHKFSVNNVTLALSQQKLGKAAGPEGICMEAFLYGGHRLHLYLSLLFNAFLLYEYLPSAFMEATIIPLVKNKSGDLTDVSNLGPLPSLLLALKY